MKPTTRISSLLALAAIAIAASPAAGASAQAPQVPLAPFVAEPITTTLGLALPSIGNGATAYAVRDNPFDSNATGTTIGTLRDGKATIAAKLPALIARRVEAGTDAAGHPVAIVSGFPKKATPLPFFLVRLDTGFVQQLRLRPHARLVQDVAIDAGRVLYVTTRRGRSSLWTARLDGSGLTKRERLRTSPRGVTFETVRADRNRIAVTGFRKRRDQPNDPGADLPLYAGTARGVWRRVGNGGQSGGGVFSVEAAGFSRSRRSVIVTTTGPESTAPPVKSVSLRTGRTRKLILETSNTVDTVELAAAFDPMTGRLLLSSSFSGGFQLGWSNVLR